MKKLHLPFLLCFACFIPLLYSCEVKDNTPCTARYTYHYLKVYEKEVSPYLSDLNFDTLMFKTSSGDTLAFALLENDSGWYVEDNNRNPNPDGCPDWQYYEKHNSRFLTFKGIGSFNSVIAGKSQERIVPTITYSLNEFLSNFNPSTFGNNSSINYIGTKNINGVDYNDVFYTPDWKNKNILHYFSKSQGLLLIENEKSEALFSKVKH